MPKRDSELNSSFDPRVLTQLQQEIDRQTRCLPIDVLVEMATSVGVNVADIRLEVSPEKDVLDDVFPSGAKLSIGEHKEEEIDGKTVRLFEIVHQTGDDRESVWVKGDDPLFQLASH